MKIETFLENPDVKKTVTAAVARVKARAVSDIIDDEGLQYVDFVMEGGGMLGIALVGYTYVLEQAGIRFLGVGGTSAGSINALLLAALDVPAKPKSRKILTELCNKNFYDFVDGDSDARDFVRCMVEDKGPFVLTIKGLQIVDNIMQELGLNPGKAFSAWIDEVLARENVLTLSDLEGRLSSLPKNLRTRAGKALDTPNLAGSRVALVAADVTTESKVVFPDMAELYFSDPSSEKPSRFVRASMSIPYFFEPYVVRDIPRNSGQYARWKKHTGLDKKGWKIPDAITFVDGGIMSNFPIALFHDPTRVPDAPTFGVKLGLDAREHVTDGPMKLLGAIFNSARHCLDYDFICQNPDYRQLVYSIPVDEYNWLDFDMSDENKLGLFKEGVFAAGEFLETFDWEAYKETRKGLKAAVKAVPKTKSFI